MIVDGIVMIFKALSLENILSPKTVRPFIREIRERKEQYENEEDPINYNNNLTFFDNNNDYNNNTIDDRDC